MGLYFQSICAEDYELQDTKAFLFEWHREGDIGITLKYKGNLRISWALDTKHNKNIDLIFFPEKGAPINYAFLYAKDFPKTIYEDSSYPRTLDSIKVPYNINYDFVKEILSQSTLSKAQQERFFEMRFGSVFIPMEIDFEWYVYIDGNTEGGDISFYLYDKYLQGRSDDIYNFLLCFGVIKSYVVLPLNTPIDFDSYFATDFTLYSFSVLFTPLPTAALATTRTKFNDYLVNVRDKPNSKEGKIITQLLTQDIIIPDNFFAFDGEGSINPIYEAMVQQGRKWYEEDDRGSSDSEGYFMYYHYKAKQIYYKKEKQNLINPLNADEYLILVWNIEPNEWAKVWILRMIRDEDYIGTGDKKEFFKGYDKQRLFGEWDWRDTIQFFTQGSYTQTFLQSPSSLKLYEGYIHTSGLQYLAPFSENYIQR